MSEHDITLTVDGDDRALTVESRTLLVDALRRLDYTAPKVGCEFGKCGACTVRLDGDAVKACTVLAVQADGGEVLTAEGLAADGLHPVQEAFHEHHGLQCGYCTPGMVATAVDLLDDDRDPDEDEVRKALKGNVCRCTGYDNVVSAVDAAADRLAEPGDEPASDRDPAPAPSPGEED